MITLRRLSAKDYGQSATNMITWSGLEDASVVPDKALKHMRAVHVMSGYREAGSSTYGKPNRPVGSGPRDKAIPLIRAGRLLAATHNSRNGTSSRSVTATAPDLLSKSSDRRGDGRICGWSRLRFADPSKRVSTIVIY